jgi:DNA-directed RNA polymerase specialized sigma24 family protein
LRRIREGDDQCNVQQRASAAPVSIADMVAARRGVVEAPDGTHLLVTPPPPWSHGPILVARSPLLKWRPVIDAAVVVAPPAVVSPPPPRALRLTLHVVAKPQPPCITCPLRSGCRAICDELAAELPPEEPEFHREVAKAPAIVDFIASVQRAAEEEPEADEAAVVDHLPWAELVANYRPALLRAINDSEALTDTQRQLVLSLLAGVRQIDIARAWRVKKPTVNIMLRRARARLGAALGQRLPPPRFSSPAGR